MPEKTRRCRIVDLVRVFDVPPRPALDLLARERQPALLHPGGRARLHLSLRGRRLGFSLEEIEKMLALYDLDPFGKTQLKEVPRMG